MKKVLTVLLIILSIFILILIICYNLKPFSLITEKNVSKINITIYKTDGTTDLLELYEKKSVEEVLNIILDIQVKPVFFPTGDGQQSDPQYKIVLYYNNEKKEVLYSTETGDCFFRFLPTRGKSGANGYVMGKSTALKNYIDLLPKSTHF